MQQVRSLIKGLLNYLLADSNTAFVHDMNSYVLDYLQRELNFTFYSIAR